MGDLISREAAIGALREAENHAFNSYYQGLKKAHKIIADLPPVKPQEPKWIPVSEGFPKEHLCDDGYVEPSDYVLVWGNHGNYGVSRYWGNRRSKSESPNTHKDWVDLDWVVQKPIAWMPLPKPYLPDTNIGNISGSESEDKE